GVFLAPLACMGGDAPARGVGRGVVAGLGAPPPGAGGWGGRRADGTAEVTLDDPEPATAPGQACVLYDGNRVLGGGWITGTARSALPASRDGHADLAEMAAA
ncbi:MAG: hypothetical protein OXI75_04015, partial [Rhodospirillales bacterium]|nr:hypothetical protein [Rhodospirillales bacterium]